MTSLPLLDDLLADTSFDLGWSLIERFAVLIRESGSIDERAAAHFIVSRLESLGIPYDLYEPELYLSVPKSASVELLGAALAAKTPSFATSTGPKGLSAEPVHVPATLPRGSSELFKAAHEGEIPDVAGKIVITEGYPMPVSVARFEAAGAVGQLYINPGPWIHWGICTPIWGVPGEAQLDERPKTPVVAVNRLDGDRVVEAVSEGLERITIKAELDEGWFSCPLPVARIEGDEKDFVLVHGHYDSWDIGIGDNAVGDATLLELARIFHENREGLRRSVRIAWWPGHSTGRYAGSTWYADNFALDLHRHCVAAVNIDSPGCRGATAYDEVAWMAETGEVARSSIQAVTGVEPTRQRPLRAGDYSFNHLGISSFYMLMSNMPQEERERLGFYPVGGCGGNIAWHTEKDRIEIADRENLERDLRVYLTAVARFLNDDILPLDFRETVAELNEALQGYEVGAHKRFDISAIRKGLDAVTERLGALYTRIEDGEIDPADANDLLLRLGRLLVPLGYTERARFEHDPAMPRAPIPRLAKINELEALMEEEESARLPFVRTDLRRGANEVAQRLAEASWLVDRLGGGPGSG